ncbi:unnamed protein product [Anisakis simplex]|uniref:Structural maintenance of chromosomes protein 6 (inferred by orthology to a human protein) n=1 Tax=Anisakis simplex TaxID=6269 RepID=A0A0M3K326_ANISI|nr:unnamed protein product [Anisakis simplex]
MMSRKRRSSEDGVQGTIKKSKRESSQETTRVPAVPGRVISIELENFMCHKSMKMDLDVFHNNCFFIGGRNGSGKSAVLAALNIGLGGQSSMSDRGNAVKEYIKHGTRSSVRSLPIHRRIKSRRRKMEKVFITATGLDVLVAKYRHHKEVLNVLTQKVDESRQLVKQLESDYMLTKLRFTQTESMNKLLKEIAEIEWIKCWLPYRDTMMEMKNAGEFVAKVDAKKEKRLASKQKKTQMKDELLTKNAAMRAQQITARQEIEKYEAEEGEKREEYETCKTSLKKMCEECHKKKLELNNTLNDIQSFTKMVDDINKKKMEQESGRKEAKLRERISKLNEELEENKANRVKLEEQDKKLNENIVDAEKKLSDRRGELMENEEKMRLLKHKKERVDSMKLNEISKFGKFMPNILALIEKYQKQFTAKPIGPLGKYVRIKNAPYEAAIEQQLRSVLSAFIVNNHRDFVMFKRILRDHNLRFTSERYKTSWNEPSGEYQTILRSIEIDDANVHNLLIDQLKIEQILLLESDEMARELMSNRPPNNVRRAITMSGGEAIAAKKNQIYRFYAGNISSSELRILSQTQSIDTQQLQAEFMEAQKSLARCRSGYDEAKEQYQNARRDAQMSTKRIEKISELIGNLELEKSKREKELDLLQLETGDDKQLEALVREFERQTIQEYRVKEQEQREEIERGVARREEMTTDCKKLRENVKKMQKKVEQLKENFDTLKEEFREVTAEMESVESELNQIERDLQQLDAKRKESRAEERRNNAEQNCARFERPVQFDEFPDLDKLPQSSDLESALVSLKNKVDAIRQSTQRNVTEEDVAKAKEETKKVIEERRKHFINHRGLITFRLCEIFDGLLSLRKFKGRLEISHRDKTARIVIEQVGASNDNSLDDSGFHGTDDGEARSFRDLKGLSGGERTYTLACFIMALWEIVDAPFRCMDEFDVFLDHLNRGMVMELLVKLATKRFPQKQFLFFTPLGLSDLKGNERVQIYEMKKLEHNA